MAFIEFFINIILDFILGIRAQKIVEVAELKSTIDLLLHARRYQATNYIELFRIFRHLKNLVNVSDYAFVDIGCGKGRVTIFASMFGFKKIQGIDFDLSLIEIAKQNAGRRKIDFFHIDASTVKLKKTHTIIFLYNPFDEYVLEAFIKNNNCDKFIFIYLNPLRNYLFDENGYQKIKVLNHTNHNKIVHFFKKCT